MLHNRAWTLGRLLILTAAVTTGVVLHVVRVVYIYSGDVSGDIIVLGVDRVSMFVNMIVIVI